MRVRVRVRVRVRKGEVREAAECGAFYCSGYIVWSLLKWNWFETLNG